jgi:ribokinase
VTDGMTNKKILVLGSVNADHVLNVPSFPSVGETMAGSNYRVVAGGKGANQVVACARLGGNTRFLACVGDDADGLDSIASLARDGVDTTGVDVIKDGRTGVALIFVNGEGENCIGISAEANNELTPEKIRQSEALIASADYLLMQLEIPVESVSLAAQIATKNQTQLILNPAPAVESLSDRLLGCIDVITPNQVEAETLTGVRVNSQDDAERAAALLHHRGIGTVIITMGKAGALVSDSSGKRLIAGRSVQVLDTTAAGDTFNGALVVALAEGRALDDAVSFANAAAAISVTRSGAQPSIPWRKEIESN